MKITDIITKRRALRSMTSSAKDQALPYVPLGNRLGTITARRLREMGLDPRPMAQGRGSVNFVTRYSPTTTDSTSSTDQQTRGPSLCSQVLLPSD
jgi:hypothetical protein